jgi:hypothetical protein
LGDASDVRRLLISTVLIGFTSGCTLTVNTRPPPPKPRLVQTTPPPARTPAAPRPAAPFDVVPADPEAEKTLKRALRSAAFVSTPPPTLTQRALEGTARGEARGMRGEGMRVASLGEGENASTPVSIASGDCLTIVAHGGLGVIEVDAMLITRSGSEIEVLAADRQNGPVGIIGGQNGCFVWTGAPVNAEMVVQVRRGAGPVVSELYRSR